MEPLESSPCTQVCQLAPGGAGCLGCGRIGAEIAAWMGLNNEARRAVKAMARHRLQALQAAGLSPPG